MVNHSVYTPFTRITHLEKARIVRFIRKNAGHDRYTADEITEAVECAVKERPSFGGFILTAIRDGEMLGVVVVSHTGPSVQFARSSIENLSSSIKMLSSSCHFDSSSLQRASSSIENLSSSVKMLSSSCHFDSRAYKGQARLYKRYARVGNL